MIAKAKKVNSEEYERERRDHSMSLKRFTNPKNLRGLGRPLLKRFFDEFAKELTKCKAKLPPETLEDDDYFKQLAEVFFSPKELPREMTEVLYAVLELANDQGMDRDAAIPSGQG